MIAAINGLLFAVGGSPAASIVAKVTITTALGLVATWIARTNRAAVRHTLLAATFGVTLLLPLASVLAPPIHISMPITVESRAAVPPLVETATAVPSVAPVDSRVPTVPAIPPASRFSPPDLLLAGWTAGTVLFLLPVAIGVWQIRSLRRSALPWPHGQSIVETLALETGIHRRVDVLLHEALPGPMTCGVLYPAIVLPRDAENWNHDDLNRAIVHELEHVRRCDSVSRCLARIACAVYWFHPLVWIAWRKLVLEAERSCDDAVLECSEATAYADQLVELAKRLSLNQTSPIVAMANRADLATRLGAVLDSRQRRGRAGRFSLVLASAAAAVLVIAISPLILVAAPQDQQRPMFEVASVKPVDRALMHRDHEGKQLDRAVFVDRTDLFTYIVRAYIRGGSCDMKAALGQDCPLISGSLPSWAKEDRFEIRAKLPANSLPNYTTRQLRGNDTPELNLMIQVLLEDRFHLKVHWETREIPVYVLTVGKNGPKLKQTAGPRVVQAADGTSVEIHGLSGSLRVPTPGGTPRGRLGFEASSLAEAADALGRYFDRPVLDRTGLMGEYDFTLEYEVDPSPPEPPAADKTSGLGGTVVNMFGGLTSSALSAALQDVGLRLESTKAPVEVLVIDSVEKPSEN